MMHKGEYHIYEDSRKNTYSNLTFQKYPEMLAIWVILIGGRKLDSIALT